MTAPVFCTRCGSDDVAEPRHETERGHRPVLPDPHRHDDDSWVSDAGFVRVNGSWHREADLPSPGDW